MCGPRTRSLAALAVLCSGSAIAQEPAGGASAWARAQLPAYRGRVERFTLAPGGRIDGLLLTDGTEVETPPHLSAQMTAAIRPGDTVTVRGLKAASMALVQALAIEDDETGRAVVDRGPSAPPGPQRAPSGGRIHREGRIRVLLHGIRGEVNGFLLDDGTTIRIRPVELSQLAPAFRPGAFVVAEGESWTSPYGTVLQATSVGARAPGDQASAPP